MCETTENKKREIKHNYGTVHYKDIHIDTDRQIARKRERIENR